MFQLYDKRTFRRDRERIKTSEKIFKLRGYSSKNNSSNNYQQVKCGTIIPTSESNGR